jgi:glycosyltransferase involved in cell wall biosynthesis
MFLQPQPCIRALKLARGLHYKQKNISIIFGYLHKSLTELYGYGDEFFDETVKLDDEDLSGSVKTLVEEYDPHIIHSHNAPDYLTVETLKCVPEKPLIHDVHDSLTMRNTGYTEDDDENQILNYATDEKYSCLGSDGLVYVSKILRDFIVDRYDMENKPELLFPNYVSKDLIPSEFKERLSSKDGEIHIVYAGTITSRIKGHHYDLIDIFRKIARNDLHIHIYASRGDEAYRSLSSESRYIHYHGHLNQSELMKELTQYDYGWAGFNGTKNMEHLDAVLPNKAYEYIACGLPVLTFPHRSLKEFVEKDKVGIVVQDLELKNELLLGEELRENVMEKRYDYTIESRIGDLIDFYEKTIDSRVYH